jgi:hypothetical protein
MKMTGEVCLCDRNYRKIAFRMPPSRQNRRCRVDGEKNSSENGAIIYDCVEFEVYLGNIG